jgi:hypothetical protein
MSSCKLYSSMDLSRAKASAILRNIIGQGYHRRQGWRAVVRKSNQALDRCGEAETLQISVDIPSGI